MLKLGDFFHLPQLEGLFERLVSDETGLIVVAGLDPRPMPAATADGGFLPSGRSAIFGILMREILEADPALRAVVVAEDRATVRIPRQLRRRVRLSLVESSAAYADQLSDALRYQPDVLVVGRLCAETAPAALRAARDGVRVLSQLDTVFKGAGVVRQLRGLNVPREYLDGLTWILTVQRLATLCSNCKQTIAPDPVLLAELSRRYPHLGGLAEGVLLPMPPYRPSWQHYGVRRLSYGPRCGQTFFLGAAELAGVGGVPAAPGGAGLSAPG